MSVATFLCSVEMYGFPREIAPFRSVEILLTDGAQMADVIAGIKNAIPELDSLAFKSKENRLADLYKFNVNGHLYYDGEDFKLHQGDKIALLTLMTGG